MMEGKMVKGVIGMGLPKITINKKIWIPMLESPELFTKEQVMKGIPPVKPLIEQEGPVLFGKHENTFNPNTHV
jgi:hypothetical protein